MNRCRIFRNTLSIAALLTFVGSPVSAAEVPFDQITKELTSVISISDGASPFYELFTDKEN